MNKKQLNLSRTPLIVFLLVMLVGNFSCKNTKQTIASDTPVSLFNGKDLEGWYTFIKDRGRNEDPKNVFSVENGILRITGEEWGCITTKEEFENYRLTAEFKWGGNTHAPREQKARDCGILVHSVGEDGGYNGTWMHSIEVQIIEGGTGDFIVVGDKSDKFSISSTVAPKKQGSSFVYREGGRLETISSGRINWHGRDPEWTDTLDFRGEQDVENPVGEWNTLECIVEADTITVLLNGVVVNRAINVRPSKGKIQVQSEAAEILFRKIDLTPL